MLLDAIEWDEEKESRYKARFDSNLDYVLLSGRPLSNSRVGKRLANEKILSKYGILPNMFYLVQETGPGCTSTVYGSNIMEK